MRLDVVKWSSPDLTPRMMTTLEVIQRSTETGPQLVTLGSSTPTGGRRLRFDGKCQKCHRAMKAGDMYRMRRLGFTSKLWACHVQCPQK